MVTSAQVLDHKKEVFVSMVVLQRTSYLLVPCFNHSPNSVLWARCDNLRCYSSSSCESKNVIQNRYKFSPVIM